MACVWPLVYHFLVYDAVIAELSTGALTILRLRYTLHGLWSPLFDLCISFFYATFDPSR